VEVMPSKAQNFKTDKTDIIHTI